MLVVARIVLMTLLNQLAWFPPSGAPPPYAESWLEACLSVTPATRREGSAPANAESRSGHGIMVPGRACSALQFSDFCCPGRQTGCLRALGHPIFRGLWTSQYLSGTHQRVDCSRSRLPKRNFGKAVCPSQGGGGGGQGFAI